MLYFQAVEKRLQLIRRKTGNHLIGEGADAETNAWGRIMPSGPLCPRTVFSFRAYQSPRRKRGAGTFLYGEETYSKTKENKKGVKMSGEVQVQKNKIAVGEAVKQGFEVLKRNFVLLLVTTAITVLISGFTGTLLLGPMMMGMFYICDRLILGEIPKAEIGDLFTGFSFIVPGIILDVLGDAGALVCGVGIVITLPVATWAMMRIVDTKMSLGDALKDTIRFIFTEKNYSFILLHIVAGVLAGIGALLCGVGVFVTLPLFFVIPACAYRQVYPQDK